MKKNIVCVISGPTATGKTSTSIKMAKFFHGEIVNFDSLLFYQELQIGTARPTIEEMSGVPHHLVGTNTISEPINAASYCKLVIPIINSLHAHNKIVFLVGGSGFYLQALLKGMYDSETTPDHVTQKSNKIYQETGIIEFLNILADIDPVSFESIHTNDHYRIRRAVEHFWTHGTPFSQAKKNMQTQDVKSTAELFNWNVFHAYLDIPKEEHYSYILQRTNKMFDDGLISEVEEILKMDFTGTEKPLQSIGYKETLDYLDGKFKNLNECKERINISTRQLAKSQRTWFNKVDKLCYNPLNDFDTLIHDFENFVGK